MPIPHIGNPRPWGKHAMKGPKWDEQDTDARGHCDDQDSHNDMYVSGIHVAAVS